MVTFGVVALVLIAWFSYRAYVTAAQAKLQQAYQEQYQLRHWTSESEHGSASVERVLSFVDMRLVTKVSNFGDGGYLADMYSRQKESWERDHEELERDGWTKDEWMAHGVQQFDVRRLPDGAWEGRLVRKQWKARVQEILKRPGREDDFKTLTGITKQQWQERGDFYDDQFRPWEKIEEFAPSIETAYQRYIHASS